MNFDLNFELYNSGKSYIKYDGDDKANVHRMDVLDIREFNKGSDLYYFIMLFAFDNGDLQERTYIGQMYKENIDEEITTVFKPLERVQ